MFFAELQSYSGSDFKYFSSLSAEMVMSLHDLNILELDKKNNKQTDNNNKYASSLTRLSLFHTFSKGFFSMSEKESQ